MRKIIPMLLLSALWLGSCRTDGDPERVAVRFLKAYYAGDFEAALRLAAPETRGELENTLAGLQADGVPLAEWQATLQSVTIEVEGVLANDGSQAVCAYKVLTAPDDANALIETLLLVMTDRGWRASF